MRIGYTAGVFDLFHVGHVRLLKNAKNLCDRLIVGVSTDEYVMSYKNKSPVIKCNDRMEILQSIKYVDVAIKQENNDRIALHKKIKFDIMFVGDDWYENTKWIEMEKELGSLGVKIIYFPYTKEISTTKINEIIKNSSTLGKL